MGASGNTGWSEKRRPFLVLVFLFAAGQILLSSSCGRGKLVAEPPRLVILYATCTVNKDYLSPYDPSVPYTPNLDRFSRTATVFTKHYTESGQSGIAFASIFTGSQANHHKIYRHPTRLPEDVYLISEAFSENGYDAFFWSGHEMASASLGYGKGTRAENTFEKAVLKARDGTFRKVLARLRSDPDYRAFLLTNFSVTHGPYGVDRLGEFLRKYPAEWKGITLKGIEKYGSLYRENRHDLQWNFTETSRKLGLSRTDIRRMADVVELLYKSRISFLDRLFGRVVEQVDAAGLLDESLIAFTADHGEVMYREDAHVKWEHGNVMLPDVLNVPFIVHAPVLEAGPRRWERVTRSIDVLPTLLGLSGIAVPEGRGIEGVDLTRALLGREEPPVLLAYSHSTVPMARPGLRKRRENWTLLRYLFPQLDVSVIWSSVRDEDGFYRWRHFGEGRWDFEAFDLTRDPGAVRNLFDESNPKHAAMAGKLREYKALLTKQYEDDADRRLPDEQAEDRLRSLGYIE